MSARKGKCPDGKQSGSINHISCKRSRGPWVESTQIARIHACFSKVYRASYKKNVKKKIMFVRRAEQRSEKINNTFTPNSLKIW